MWTSLEQILYPTPAEKKKKNDEICFEEKLYFAYMIGYTCYKEVYDCSSSKNPPPPPPTPLLAWPVT